ncbi:pentapeptide repeat-containing protein [Rhodococcus sp. ANT_H53B]|uniref:pentapeptide repeat-containing protein n=1 Tax=Rhodococcus sp. ANT_H53B TaxID=2597357 RepID=UPI0011ED947B|nr:pentapeptide repeat-containing protein [Rhodococcus sp. ANT_H53B]KAA0921610.1 pentapeptide repeat-containing protein [Rhodococcus sp. ANT_H53B]
MSFHAQAPAPATPTVPVEAVDPPGIGVWFLDNLTQPAATVLASVGIIVAAVITFIIGYLSRRQLDRHHKATHTLADIQELRRRFVTTSAQFADPSPEVRLAGVYALEALTNDWIDHNRNTDAQTCINYLCGYLTRPYAPPTHDPHLRQTVVTVDAATTVESTYQHPHDDLTVRQAITRTIATHLKPDHQHNWSNYNYDFTGAYFHNADFNDARFYGTTTLDKAQFHGDWTSFSEAQFHGETTFDEAQFHGMWTSFGEVQFRGALTFGKAQFHGETTFSEAQFHGMWTSFDEAQFHGMWTSFGKAQFHGALTLFSEAQFHGEASFGEAQFHGALTFEKAQFHGEASFGEVQFHGETTFGKAQFHGETTFSEAQFHGETTFSEAQFHGETLFNSPGAWNNVYFDWDTEVPYAAEGSKPDNVKPHDWPPTVVEPTP